MTEKELRPPGFFWRLFVFTIAFYAGAVLCVTLLTVIKTAVFFNSHFWSALLDWVRFDVLPIALTELVRSPILGLIFAAVGTRKTSLIKIRKSGATCGVITYAAGYFLTILGSDDAAIRQVISDFGLVDVALYALPVLLILLSRFNIFGRKEADSAEEDGQT